MAVYEYIAKDTAGKEFLGKYSDISNVDVLREDLGKIGYTLVKATKQQKSILSWKKKVKKAEIITFVYRFSGMYSAGLSISECLAVLEQQTENSVFRNIISEIRKSVEMGSSLKKAFEKHTEIFSDFFIGMIEAGESGGKLATTLEMSAQYMEKQFEIKRKVKAAFAYPIVVSVLCFLIVACMIIFIIPVFSKLYRQLHVQLPGPTQMLVNVSTIVGNFWWVLILIGVVLVVLGRFLKRKPGIKIALDSLKLNIPVFSGLNQMMVVSRFIRSFAMLASTGISFIDALDIASRVAKNAKVSEISEQLQQSIEAGNTLASSLKEYDIFPPIIIHLAASGEQAGVLPEMLNKGVDFLDKDINRAVDSLLMKLEPAMTVIMGTIVGLIIMAVYLPIFDYMTHLQ